MADKTEVKLDISVDMMAQYKKDGGGKFKKNLDDLKIKFPDFTFKGSFDTDETDLTQKKIVTDLLRAGKGIFVQFSMGVDSDIEEVIKKKKINAKDDTAVAKALADATDQVKKDMRAENDAAHKRLRALMADILKEYSGKKEGVDFANEVQVARYLKSLKSLHDLRRDYQVFQTALVAASTDPNRDKQVTVTAKAYDKFMDCDGVHLVAAGRRIPKVTSPKTGSTKDANEKKQAESLSSMSTALEALRKGMVDVSDELEKLREGYVNLQEMLAKGGSGGSGRPADAAGAIKERAALKKAFDDFPQISEGAIKKVIESLAEAEKGLASFKKNAT